MSDTESGEAEYILPPQPSTLTEERLANLAKARAARSAGIAARRAAAQQRTAETPRTAGDARRVGVAAHPGPAESASRTRETAMPETLTRRRRSERQVGGFELPKNRMKRGWDYEYKVIRVLNQPVDPSEIMDAREGGWRPEKACDWPELVEVGTANDAPVERQGQRLYGRPMSLTVEAREEDLQYAYNQQRDKTMAAASGKSAVRGEEGIPSGRGTVRVPLEVSVEGLAG